MSDDMKNASPGKIIYNVDENDDEQAKKEAREDVDEADRESFPASDAPGFAGGTIAKEE